MFTSFGVNLLAFKAVPVVPERTRVSLFPDDSSMLKNGAKKAVQTMDGTHSALIVKGYDDEAGEGANIHLNLSQAGIDNFESGGIANIKSSYGVVLNLKQEDCEKAIRVLEV